MKHKVDINSWSRKGHFNFFKTFDEPFYGIVASVDVTKAYKKVKENNYSFFIYYLYLTLKAVNSIEEFRYRIEGDELYCYDTINASATIDRENGTFGFSLIEYRKDFIEFMQVALKEIERVRKTQKLEFYEQKNVIHASAIPWIKFTAISHARHFATKESIPKFSFGKLFNENNKLLMPVSVHVHHAVIDGYQVGQFFEVFQNLLNEEL